MDCGFFKTQDLIKRSENGPNDQKEIITLGDVLIKRVILVSHDVFDYELDQH